MSQILPEVPVWSINGTNKDFVTAQEATTFLRVTVDGVITTAYTYDGGTKTITFTDAPITSVHVIYIVGAWFALSEDEVLIIDDSFVINGTTSYVASQAIKEVVFVVVDGVETLDYSTSGTTSINFGFIPLYNVWPLVYIGYANGNVDADYSANPSQSEIITRLYDDVLHEKTSSSIYKIEVAKDMINEIQEAICTGGYVTFKGEKIKAPHLKFLDTKKYITHYETLTLSEDVSNISSSIKLQLGTVPASGYVLLNGNVIKYNSTTSTSIETVLNGLSNLKTSGKTGDKVVVVEVLPTDYLQDFKLSYWVGEVEQPVVEQDQRNVSSRYLLSYYVVRDQNKDFLVVNNVGGVLSTGDRLTLSYYKKAPDITATTNSILPDKYAITIIPYLVGARMLLVSEANTASNLEVLGVGELKRLYQVYGDNSKRYRKKIETGSNQYYRGVVFGSM